MALCIILFSVRDSQTLKWHYLSYADIWMQKAVWIISPCFIWVVNKIPCSIWGTISESNSCKIWKTLRSHNLLPKNKTLKFPSQINHLKKIQYLYDWSHKCKEGMVRLIFSPLSLWANIWVHPILESNYLLMSKK
jgi:hypothetical protein